ncbi:uncharacterized protein [Eurosta solidaginis]|uniref:uncharacterized protein n=1 Tax=Eurosta solidaginis TaxID=178769 RepID=UPI0035309EAF
MTLQLTTYAVVWLTLCSAFASAGGSSSGHMRFGRLTTRLQRQELNTMPYPAAGYRPNEPFDYPAPDKQQSFDDDDNGEQFAIQPQRQPQAQPQFQRQPHFQKQPHFRPEFPTQFQPQPQPQFHTQLLTQPQPQFQRQPQFQSRPQTEVSGFDLATTPSLGSNGDNIDAPNALYDTPTLSRQTQAAARQRLGLPRQQFSPTTAQQSRFTQVSSAALKRQGKQFVSAQPSFARNQPALTQTQLRSARLRNKAVKSERLTAEEPEQQREEREDEEDDEATDIEVNDVNKSTATGTPSVVPAPPMPTTSVFYYPAGAVGFVHPVTGAYYQPSAFISGTAPALAPTSTVGAVAAPANAVSTTTAAYYRPGAFIAGAAPALDPASAPQNAAHPVSAADASSTAAPKPAAVTVLASQVASPAIAPFTAPQYFAASPYLQQYALAAPAQLQAW